MYNKYSRYIDLYVVPDEFPIELHVGSLFGLIFN